MARELVTVSWQFRRLFSETVNNEFRLAGPSLCFRQLWALSQARAIYRFRSAENSLANELAMPLEGIDWRQPERT